MVDYLISGLMKKIGIKKELSFEIYEFSNLGIFINRI